MNTITSWWVGICEFKENQYQPIQNNEIRATKFEVNDLPTSSYQIQSSILQITSNYPIGKQDKGWDFEIDIDVNVKKDINSEVYFVFYCEDTITL